MNNKAAKIVFSGGGTAGHIFPLLEIHKTLKANRGLTFEYFGTGAQLERDLAKQNRMPYQKILCGKFRRYPGVISCLQNIIDLFAVLFGTIQALVLFLADRPSVIFSKGGYGSLPTVLAAGICRIPIIIHESDIIPGLANRIALRSAKRVATAFPVSIYPIDVRKKAFYAGLPLSEEFYSRAGLTNKNYILFFGGSQGASSLNELVFQSLEKILQIAPVIHLTGPNDFEKASQIKSALPEKAVDRYHFFEFSKDMRNLIGEAKLVVCRAGANSIFESAALGANLLLVPIPQRVTAHQVANASYLESNNMAKVFTHEQNPKDFIEAVKSSYHNDSKNILQLSAPWSSEVISQAILSEIESQNFQKTVQKIFLIGIGGVSMRGIAAILQKMGKKIYGSDIKTGGHSAENIKKDFDLVVYSSAASVTSSAREEHERAAKYNIETIKRSVMIRRLLNNKSSICVSGMHGKTTSSALISRALEAAGLSPSYLIGAMPTKLVPTANYSPYEYFVVEACEYDGSFLDFPTTIGLITNIEEEHLDYFKGGLEEIVATFAKFVKKIRPGGLLVYNLDDQNVRKVIALCSKEIEGRHICLLSFGFDEKADVRVSSYKVKNERISFCLSGRLGKAEIDTAIAGRHFAYNCAGGYAICRYLGVSDMAFARAISNFHGAKGRFEYLGQRNNIPVYYDYGHHPTELKSLFAATNDLFGKKRKFFIFEPHQQDRFNRFYKQFYQEISKSNMDVIGLLPVYRVAGRDAKAEFTSRDLVDKLSENKKKAFLFKDYAEAVMFLKKNCKSGDFVITVGATDVWKVAEEFIKK